MPDDRASRSARVTSRFCPRENDPKVTGHCLVERSVLSCRANNGRRDVFILIRAGDVAPDEVESHRKTAPDLYFRDVILSVNLVSDFLFLRSGKMVYGDLAVSGDDVSVDFGT